MLKIRYLPWEIPQYSCRGGIADVLDLVKNPLREFGIDLRIGGPRSASDIDWVHTMCKDSREGFYILDDDWDAGHLSPGARELLAEDTYCLGITKGNPYKDREWYNSPHIHEVSSETYTATIHYKQFWDLNNSYFEGITKEYEPKLSSSSLSKIVSTVSYPCYPWIRDLFTKTIEWKEVRENYLGFVGCLTYPTKEIEIHRKLALEALRRYHSKHKDKKVYYGIPRLQGSDYYSLLEKTQISLSPWGWGERCYRDAESLALGCVLIKPQTDYIETWPDIYLNGETYVSCKADFTDLDSIVESVIINHEKLNIWRETIKVQLGVVNIARRLSTQLFKLVDT